MGTIYRKLIMSPSKKKKEESDLGHVWVAAHFPKRIKEDIVQQTDITFSVDKILDDQLPVVTYRILGFLLLGVTRIYSKKVEYLLRDCNHSLHEMKVHFEGRTKVNTDVGGMCLPESSSKRSKPNVVDAPASASSSKKSCNAFVEAMSAQFSSISLPENFELDAFDLEIVEDDSNDSHVKSHLEIVLKDAWVNDRTMRHTFDKDRGDVFARFSDDASDYAMIMNISQNNSETSAENLLHKFSLNECVDPVVLSEPENEVDLPAIPFIEQEPECSNIKSVENNMMFQDRGHPYNHTDEECTTTQTVVSGMTSVDNIILKPSPNKSQLSVTINVTPQSKAPAVSGERKSDFVALRTPASREHVRAQRKRKCVYDDDLIVIPNKVIKKGLEDARDLVRKRRRAPSALLAWKQRRSFDYFMEPIIPINADFPSDPKSFISKSGLTLQKEVETIDHDPQIDGLGPHKIPEGRDKGIAPHEVLEGRDEVISPNEILEERDEGIAPSTPVTQSTSTRFRDIPETSMANQVGASSSKNHDKKLFLLRDVGLDETNTEEGPSSDGEDSQVNAFNGEKWSTVTKRVGAYLHSNFLQRKQKGEEEAVSLSHILKKKTKKESAKFFSQILVLKSGGYIDVNQERPYAEIRVMQTPKLNQVFGAAGQD